MSLPRPRPLRYQPSVMSRQAFHWCPDYDKASAEFARALKPGGIVAFIWNLEDRSADFSSPKTA